MFHKILADRATELKGIEEGGKTMGKALEEYKEFVQKEKSKEIARKC